MQSITRSMVGRCVGILRWMDSFLGLWMGHTQFWCSFFSSSFSFGTIKQLKDTILGSTDLAGKILFPEHVMLRTLYCWILNLEKVLLPPLHINLGIMKNFVKALDRNSEGILYLCSKFPNLSDARGKRGIFVGVHIGKVTCDKNFKRKFNSTEMAAWTSFRSLVYGFLDIRKEENYQKLVCQISLNIHM